MELSLLHDGVLSRVTGGVVGVYVVHFIMSNPLAVLLGENVTPKPIASVIDAATRASFQIPICSAGRVSPDRWHFLDSAYHNPLSIQQADQIIQQVSIHVVRFLRLLLKVLEGEVYLLGDG